jgi:hypothetical protein
MSSDTFQIEIIDEVINASLSDETFRIDMDGSGVGIGSVASVEELNRYAYNIAFNAFRLSQLMNSMFFQMEDGFMDWLDDQTYVDLVNSVNQLYVNYFGTVNYYTPIQVGYVPQNMTVQSIAVDSNGVSGQARINILMEEVDAITLNTDLKAYASRDNGVTWTEAVLEVEGNLLNNFKVLTAEIDLSLQPEDLYMVYKVCSFNNKNLKIFSVSLSWL